MNKTVKTVTTRYTFTIRDEEIVEESMLALSCDEDTWLYEPKRKVHNNALGKIATGHSTQIHEMSQSGGGVDSRTYCRRRKSSQPYSLDPVSFPTFEVADINNVSTRSSLGILNGSVNDSLTRSIGGRVNVPSSCDFIDSEPVSTAMSPVFKLDSPLSNNPPSILTPARHRYEILRLDSESLDASVPLSLKDSSLEDHGVMTSSMVNFVNDRSKPLNELVKARTKEAEAMLSSVNLESMTGSVLLAAEMTDSTASDTENVPPPPTAAADDNRLRDEIAPPTSEYIVHEDSSQNCLTEKEALNETFTIKRSLGGGDDSDRSLNNKDMNRTYELELGNRTNDLMNRSFTKNELLSQRGLPSRRSTFNSTFTKLLPGSTETLEDEDRGSNASVDSLCSAGSASSRGHKPRSVEDLRAEAHRQQTVLNSTNSTSTPENTNRNKHTKTLDMANWEVTPIVPSETAPRCNTATVTRPTTGLTKLRRPTQMTNVNAVAIGTNQRSQTSNPGPDRRPATAPPTAAPGNVGGATAIPRPRPSRLPMPTKFRSGIPTAKRGGLQ